MFFSKPTTELTFNDIEDFCKQGIAEGFNLDYKENFPKDLAKTISAFANTFGGVIIIGVEEDDKAKPVLPIKGVVFERGLDLKVTNIILDTMTPPIFPEVGVIQFKVSETIDDKEQQVMKAVIIIKVPQSNEAPHLIDNKRSVYIRTDNRNKQEEIATIDEIGWLFNKRKKSEDLREKIYQNSLERLENLYKNGFLQSDQTELQPPDGQGIFAITPLYPNSQLISVKDLANYARSEEFGEPDYFGSWSRYPIFDPEPVMTQQSVINYQAGKRLDQGLRAYFYELSTFGLFLVQETFGRPDSAENQEGDKRLMPNKLLWPQNITAHLDLFLEIALKLYEKLNIWGLVQIKIVLNDIFNMRVKRPDSIYSWDEGKHRSHQENLYAERILTVKELKEKRLEILESLINEIGLAFNFDIGQNFVKNYLKTNRRLD